MPREGSGCAIRAVVRVRPLLQHEADRGDRVCCEVTDGNNMVIQTAPGNQWRQYAFDACLPMDCVQKQAFQESGVTNLLDSAMMGYSATVLAYGQTGSGKTYTMIGRLGDQQRGAEKSEDGLIVRTAKRLFRLLGNGALQPDEHCTVSVSFTEIFNAPGAVNECICDLLNPEAKNLQVRHNKKHGFFVSDLCVVDCESAADVRQVLEEGVRSRKVASHALNKDSSRSHALFTLHIDVESPPDVPGGQPVRRYGKITFVDLAGSERLKESAAEGHTLKETQAINKSLFTLGQVISMLSSGKAAQHVPYRNSKLTQLLQESFGGEALCLMVTCISPAMAFAEESLNSLRYATKAMNIRNMPVVRLDEREQLVHNLKAENIQLKKELSVYKGVYGNITPRDQAGTALSPRALAKAMSGALKAQGSEEPWKPPGGSLGAVDTPETHRSVAQPADIVERRPSMQSQASNGSAKAKRPSKQSDADSAKRSSSPFSAARVGAESIDSESMAKMRRGAGLGQPTIPENLPGSARKDAEVLPGSARKDAQVLQQPPQKRNSKPPAQPQRRAAARGRSAPPDACSSPCAPPLPGVPVAPPAAPRTNSRGPTGSYAVVAAKRRQVQESAAQSRNPSRPAAVKRTGSGGKPASLPPLPGRSPSSASLDRTSCHTPSSAAGSHIGSMFSERSMPAPKAHQLAPLAESPTPTLDARVTAQVYSTQKEVSPREALPRPTSQVPTISAPPSAYAQRIEEGMASPSVSQQSPRRIATPASSTHWDDEPKAAPALPHVTPDLVKTQLRHLDGLPWAQWQFKFDGKNQQQRQQPLDSEQPSRPLVQAKVAADDRPPRPLVQAKVAADDSAGSRRGSSQSRSHSRSTGSSSTDASSRASSRSSSTVAQGSYQRATPTSRPEPGVARVEDEEEEVEADSMDEDEVDGVDPLQASRLTTPAVAIDQPRAPAPPSVDAGSDALVPIHAEDSALAELSAKLSSMQDATSALSRRVPS